MPKTADDLTADLIAVVNERDKTVAKLNKKARDLRQKRDKLLAKESASRKLSRMSDDEVEAIKAELGV